MSVATIIRDQIGHRAFFMLGSKNMQDHGDALSFRIRGSSRVNYIKITLTPLDLYDMEFGRVRKFEYKEVARHEGVYVDMLHGLIESETGLYTKL